MKKYDLWFWKNEKKKKIEPDDYIMRKVIYKEKKNEEDTDKQSQNAN